MILVFAPPLAEFEHRIYDVRRFACEASTSTEGFHAFAYIPNHGDRVAAALTLGEIAKPYRNSLLICRDQDDGEPLEKLRFITDELQIRAKVRRFVWVRAAERYQMAIVRAFMPGNPMVDPRGVWERLP